MRWPRFVGQPDTGAVVQPQTAPLRLFSGHLQPLAPPQALDPFVVDLPAGIAKQGRDPSIAVTAILAGRFDHAGDQAVLVTSARDAALGRAVLPQHPAGPALRDPEPVADMVDALEAARGLGSFPLAASLRICLSSVRSEGIFPARFKICTNGAGWGLA